MPSGCDIKGRPLSSTGHGGPYRRQRKAPDRHVLVVDDEELIRESVGLLLEDDDYRVSFAENGHEALTLLQEEDLPDIIMLDLRMPVMDGWAFRRIQKGHPRFRAIPVVAISADESAQAAAISAEAYVQRPVQANDLLATLDRVLFESEGQASARVDSDDQALPLRQLAEGVGHEVNNPLTFLTLSLEQAVEMLRLPLRPASVLATAPVSSDAQLGELEQRCREATELLQNCQVGVDRIQNAVSDLLRLTRGGGPDIEEFLQGLLNRFRPYQGD